ncbi:odorant receptor Or1-like [Xylocopa sonorina]|uniref:odorant receptor Or1-like n=1 Tax=Xylocopa sonorina TaxID=1818115 RepID=UPI00403B2059
MFCEVMDLIFNVETVDDFCDNIYIILGIGIGYHKMHSILVSRKNIIAMADMLESEPFRPETEEEIKIRNRCIEQVRSIAIRYLVLMAIAVVSIVSGGYFKTETNSLPYRLWLPYNYTSLSAHAFVYVQEAMSLLIGAMSHAAVDTLIWSLLMYTHNQIEIFECRLKKIERNEKDTVKLCVRYHNHIYRNLRKLRKYHRFARILNDEFKMVMFSQTAMSILMICMRLHILTGMKLTPNRVLEALCFACVTLAQIYIFCWYGNEVKLKSLAIPDMIFDMDWTVLDRTVKRDLLMIMMRSMSPIEMTSGHVVTMTLKSFSVILKSAYSAYNLLQNGYLSSFYSLTMSRPDSVYELCEANVVSESDTEYRAPFQQLKHLTAQGQL